MGWCRSGRKAGYPSRRGVWSVDHGACVLLPAPSASAGGLLGLARGVAGAIGRGSTGTKGAGASCQSAVDHQGRDPGYHGCRPADAGAGTAGDARY